MKQQAFCLEFSILPFCEYLSLKFYFYSEFQKKGNDDVQLCVQFICLVICMFLNSLNVSNLKVPTLPFCIKFSL